MVEIGSLTRLIHKGRKCEGIATTSILRQCGHTPHAKNSPEKVSYNMVTIPNRKSASRVTVQVHWHKSTTSLRRATSKLTGQDSEKYLASTNIFLPPANEVWGKVIFLHLSVILFTGGRGGTPRQVHPLGRYPPPPPGQVHIPWAGTAPR